MHRYPLQLVALQRQLGTRTFTSTHSFLSKASKERSTRKPKSFSSPSPTATAGAGAYASAPAPGQAGTDVGRSSSSGEGALFERGGGEGVEQPKEVGVEEIEKQFEQHQKEDTMTEEDRAKENQAGTDVGNGIPLDQPESNGVQKVSIAGEQPTEELIYTAQPPYNVALIMSAAFVVGVFCFVTADLARVGIAVYNEETGEYEVAPKWKRYTLAIGAAGVGTAAVAWGTLAPSRLVTKMTINRASSTATNPAFLFPRDSIISIHSPLTRLSSKFGQRPRQVPLYKIQLLGPLSDSPKPYHPLFQQQQQKKQGRISTFLNSFLPSPTRSKSSTPSPWNKEGKRLSHSPILIEGDRASYSIALKRSSEPNSDKGAWMKDWDQFERALLNVDEARYQKRQYYQ